MNAADLDKLLKSLTPEQLEALTQAVYPDKPPKASKPSINRQHLPYTVEYQNVCELCGRTTTGRYTLIWDTVQREYRRGSFSVSATLHRTKGTVSTCTFCPEMLKSLTHSQLIQLVIKIARGARPEIVHELPPDSADQLNLF